MNLRSIRAVAIKELLHIVRDGQTLGILISLPVIMMFLFGYALKSEIEEAPIVFMDPASSAESTALRNALEASRQYHVVAVVSGGEAESLLVQYRARAVVCLDVDYARQIRNDGAQISVVLDASDPAVATTLRNALPMFFQKHLSQELGSNIPSLVRVDSRFLFNPDQKSALFFVPGLMAAILAMVGTLLTSVAITREKELGTLANLRISRLHPVDIILGKILPYFLVAAVDGLLILSVGRWAFGVHIQGDAVFLAGATALYLVVALAFGLLISTLVRRQQQAMLLALGVTMMPTIMLSGFIFPLASLPWPLRWLSCVVPATWYLEIVRGVVLKAATWQDLGQPVSIVGGMALFFLVIAVRRFSREAGDG
ncbi:MAG TPA: ABC transporter permease [Fibrobacteraceae bacterium]|nr:ABC transporter permease [Fibrobacteraceae bacterium]